MRNLSSMTSRSASCWSSRSLQGLWRQSQFLNQSILASKHSDSLVPETAERWPLDLTQPREDQDDPRQRLPRDDRSSEFERPLDFPWVSWVQSVVKVKVNWMWRWTREGALSITNQIKMNEKVRRRGELWAMDMWTHANKHSNSPAASNEMSEAFRRFQMDRRNPRRALDLGK